MFPSEVPRPPEESLPVMPFLFRYRVGAPVHAQQAFDTDPTAGYESPYTTNHDGLEETDYTDDSDETDDGSNVQTGVLADSDPSDDEE